MSPSVEMTGETSAKKSRIYLALHCQRKAAGNAKCRQDGDTFASDGIRGFVDCKIRQIGARLQRSADRDDMASIVSQDDLPWTA